ncbi:MAG: TetR/AcrR family transcriptional regulator [Actinomycetia bacterium]|nr:TetR/AcrR family transcriptional regulator [Actinomycetes bacterium]
MSTYHHGDLPNALKAAAIEVITEKGVAGFSLREVARRAGVSHAAPAHHFGDSSGLLTDLACDAFVHLEARIMAARARVDDPVEALVAAARAYVELGLEHPAHCEIMFRHDLLDHENDRHAETSIAAYGALEGALIELRDAYDPELDIEAAATHCWATMQGLLVLYPAMIGLADHRGSEVPPLGDLAEQMSRLSVRGLIRTEP